MYGGGKTLRGGMGGDARLNRDAGVLDLVITNVTVIDAVQGVIKADVGIRDGRIVGIGKSGNPSKMCIRDRQGICGMASSQYSARWTRNGTRRSINAITLRSPRSANSSRRYPSLPTVPLGICAGSS